MSTTVTFGRYIAGNSLIHSLDPRIKIVGISILMVTCFLIAGPYELLITTIVILGLVTLTKIPYLRALMSIAPVLGFIAFFSLVNLFFSQSGTELVAIGFVRITTGGVVATALNAGRLLILALAGNTLLLTTTPTEISNGLESVFSPLKRLGIPVPEITFTLSLALRFVPTLIEETRTIMEAQAARGGGITEGTLMARIRALPPMIVPLFSGALRHAEHLSRALSARGYIPKAARTHYRQAHMSLRDFIFISTCIGYFIVIVVLKNFGI